MEQSKIERINILARKAKGEGLTEKERLEQAELRREYIEAYRESLRQELESVVVVDEQGNRRPLRRREERP